MRTFLLALLILLSVADALLSFKMHRKLPKNERRVAHSKGKTEKSLPDDPLSGGSGFASYYIDVKVGTPPQTLRMDPDTGSSDFVVVTPACGCNYYGTGFDPSASSSAQASTCGFSCTNMSSPLYLSCSDCTGSCGTCTLSVNYGDGSSAYGSVFRDVVELSPTRSAPIFLGAMSTASGKFSGSRDDGILGLAFPSLASGVPTFMDQLAATGVPNVFSACYGSYDGGEMTFGGWDSALVAPGNTLVLQVPVDKSTGYFGVTVSQFSMAGNTYAASVYSSAILDTGTTLLMTTDMGFVQNFRGWLASALSSASASTVAQGLIDNPTAFTCFDRTELSYFVPCLPPLQVSFLVDGVLTAVSVPASSYLWIYESDTICPGQYAVTQGVQLVAGLPGIDMILGDVFLRNVHTTYDRSGLTATFRLPNAAACGTAISNVTDTTKCSKIPIWRTVSLLTILLAAFGAGAVVLILILVICCCCCCRKKKQHPQHHHHHHEPAHDGATPAGYNTVVYAPVGQGNVNTAMAPFPTK